MLIEMTVEEAKRWGLLVCESCGHPENNHFDFDEKPCAHCPKGGCKGYVAVSRVGKIIAPSPMNKLKTLRRLTKKWIDGEMTAGDAMAAIVEALEK